MRSIIHTLAAYYSPCSVIDTFNTHRSSLKVINSGALLSSLCNCLLVVCTFVAYRRLTFQLEMPSVVLKRRFEKFEIRCCKVHSCFK